YCGSCYGGKKPASGCCNTCEEVQAAYTDMGWSFTNADSIEQCVKEHWTEKIGNQTHEGCNIFGYIEVNKVAGNFHLAPGKSFQQSHMHVHDLHRYSSAGSGYDFSHTIHSLSFGERVLQNPLDNVVKVTKLGFYTFQYYVKVVSTKFTFLNGTTIHTNQFSATEHERDATPVFGTAPTALPGVFFNYDISPMLVIYTQSQKPFAHFLTDVCAIVGGIFTVAGIIDSFIYTAEKTFKKKLDLGKAS
ncbi:endoplasmic reticulum vesicle transporter, partial [Blyttiomyces helicus]